MHKPLIVLLLLALPALMSAQSLPGWLKGHWKGIGYQTDVDTTWMYRVSWFSGQGQPVVDYPLLKCSGHWAFRRREKDRLVFQEIVTQNPGYCTNRDWIYVRPAGPDKLRLEFAKEADPHTIIATATLSRHSMP